MMSNLESLLEPIDQGISQLLAQAAIGVSYADTLFKESLGRKVVSGWDLWLEQHPLLAWILDHPFVGFCGSLLIAILLLRLLAMLYRIIAESIDRLGLWILRSPWLLLKLLFGWEKKVEKPSGVVNNYEVISDAEKLQDILSRLEQIQQQQQEIIQELALLKQPESGGLTSKLPRLIKKVK